MLLRISTIVAVAVLLLSIVVTFRWMVADFYGSRVVHSLEDWLEPGVVPSDESLELHLEFANQAIAWAPSNPRYKELKARLLLIQALRIEDKTSDEFVHTVKEMLVLHRAATTERPRWPYSWANLALAKAFNREYDDEYRTAVRRAVEFGPYEIVALDRVIRSAVPVWTKLGQPEKAAVETAVANSVLMSSGSAITLRQIFDEAGLLETTCETINFHTEESKSRLCG